jgi:hypothetical protein
LLRSSIFAKRSLRASIARSTFREHSGNIQGTFREHSGNIQGTCGRP